MNRQIPIAAHFRSQQLCLNLLFILTAILFSIIISETPYYADDMTFRRPLGSSGISWNDFVESVRFYYPQLFNTQSNRIANYLGPFFLCLVPKWLFGIITGILIYISLRIPAKIFSERNVNDVAIYIFTFAFVVLPPWDNIMFTVMFALNYIWPTALAILTIYFSLRLTDGKRYSKIQLFRIYVLALITGGMHEGISVPLICGLCAYCLILRKKVHIANYVVIILLLAGALSILLGPALTTRAHQMLTENNNPHPFNISGTNSFFCFCYFNCCWCAFLLLSAFTLLLKKWRSKFSCSDFALLSLLLTASTVTLGFYFHFYATQRTLWMQIITSSLGMSYILGKCMYPSRSVAHATAILTSFLILFNLTWSAVEQRHKAHAFNLLVKQYIKSDNGQIFTDIAPHRLTPSLKKAMTGIVNNEFVRQSISSYYGDFINKPLRILPGDLAHVSAGKILNCQSVVDMPNVFIFKSHLIAIHKPDKELILSYHLTNGNIVKLIHKPTEFTTPDSTKLYYLEPQLSVWHNMAYDFSAPPLIVSRN